MLFISLPFIKFVFCASFAILRSLRRPDERGKSRWWYRLRRRATWRATTVCAYSAMFVYFSHPSVGSIIIGSLLIVTGEWLRIWAAGHLRKNEQVTTTGPYSHAKNPLYLGSLFILVGFGVMAQVYLLLAVGLLVFVMYYAPYKKHRERDRLRERFGEIWINYDVAVPDYLPRLRPYPQRGGERWRLSRVGDNSEHGTAAAVFFGMVLLVGLWWRSLAV